MYLPSCFREYIPKLQRKMYRETVSRSPRWFSRNLLTLGREFESRCSHTNWHFSSQKNTPYGSRPTDGERLIRGYRYTKFDFTVDEGKGRLNPSRERVNSIISGRSPPLYCTLTLISMQGHQNHNPFYLSRSSGLQTVVVVIWSYSSRAMVLEKLNKIYQY